MRNLKQLEKKLKVSFRTLALLNQALTHRSFLNESKAKLKSNERLEFLGDVVLSFVISSWLYQKFPSIDEGRLTELRSGLVKTDSLAKLACQFNLGEFLLLSRGEKQSGGAKNPLLLANALEAVIGALFLDQGIEVARSFIEQNFDFLLAKLIQGGETKDCKSILQEKVQALKKHFPDYTLIKEEGPDHDKLFTVAVVLDKKIIALGKGKSKQAAEEKAAQAALEKLGLND